MRSSRPEATRVEGPAECVLGVDPGTFATGWGVVQEDGRHLRYVASGVIRPRGARADRLAAIYQAVRAVCERFGPSAMVIEQTFVGENIQSAFRLGEARGAVMVAAAQAQVTLVEYTPAEIKVAVAGSGRAPKAQMQAMVARLLGVDPVLAADEADALGAAVCHLHSRRFAATVAAHRPGLDGGARARRASRR